MNHVNWTIQMKQGLKAATALALSLAFTACTKGGGISSSAVSSISGAITISKVYPTSDGENWTPITASGRYYIKGLELTITGTCTRGVTKIKVHEGSSAAYSETATCLDIGTFTFQKTFTATSGEGDWDLTLAAYDVADAAISGATATVNVRIDATAPTTPVVTDPASTPLVYNGASSTYVVTGTCSADTATMTGPGGVTITPTGTNWTYDAHVVAGAATDYTFYAYDLAGNQSAGFTQRITWTPSASLLASGVISGGLIADSGASGMHIEASMDQTQTGKTQDTGVIFNIAAGFNYIINKARGL